MADPIKDQQGNIVGFTKPKRFFFFKLKSKPIYGITKNDVNTGVENATNNSPLTDDIRKNLFASRIDFYLDKVVAKHRSLEQQMKEVGIRGSPQQFAKKMMKNALIIALLIGIAVSAIFYRLLSNTSNLAVIAIFMGAFSMYAAYNVLFAQFLRYPATKEKSRGKEIDKSILFAARDIMISLRSGVPLFNALTSVSTGYGAASAEFAKIINLVQLGMPMEQAIEQVSNASGSKVFKRIMLQASVSIKQGADVVVAMQEVIDQATQERAIELRRYGQRLNALSMFYMLFGVILPSMGIAVLSILTTFINLFSVTPTLLVLVLIFIAIIQFIFFTIMKNSRPLFIL
ncbi:MAG: type II secretion system F family protein [Candidatus Micrarchaeaceae archaeon]